MSAYSRETTNDFDITSWMAKQRNFLSSIDVSEWVQAVEFAYHDLRSRNMSHDEAENHVLKLFTPSGVNESLGFDTSYRDTVKPDMVLGPERPSKSEGGLAHMTRDGYVGDLDHRRHSMSVRNRYVKAVHGDNPLVYSPENLVREYREFLSKHGIGDGHLSRRSGNKET